MPSEEIIKDLYINFVESGESSRRCFLLRERIDTNTKELNKILYKGNQKKLERIVKDFEEINMSETEREFVRRIFICCEVTSGSIWQ